MPSERHAARTAPPNESQSHTVRGYDQPALAARLASDSGWLDLTNPQLRRILAMLKTHLRRMS